MVAAGKQQAVGGGGVAAPGLLDQLDGVLDHRVGEPGGVDAVAAAALRGGVLLAVEGLVLLAVSEEQGLRLGGVALLLGDMAQLQHPVQNQLLPLLVQLPGGPVDILPIPLHIVGVVVEGVVEGGIVDDGHQAGTLRQAQLADVLAEVALGGSGDTVELEAEGDAVEVEGDDLLLGVALLKLQGPEDLPDLPLDGDVRVVRNVPQELLGDGGPAPGAPAREGLDHGRGGAVPVHAAVLPEPVVLDVHQGLDQVVRQVAVLDDPPVAVTGVEGFIDHPLPGGVVLDIDGGGLGHGQLLHRHPHVGDHRGVDVLHEDLEKQIERQHADDAQGEEGEKNLADDPAYAALLLFILRASRAGSLAAAVIAGVIHLRIYLLCLLDMASPTDGATDRSH